MNRFENLDRDSIPVLQALVDDLRGIWLLVPCVDESDNPTVRKAIHNLHINLVNATNAASYVLAVVEAMQPNYPWDEEEF